MTDLQTERAKLCDLLIGREFRKRAEGWLGAALLGIDAAEVRPEMRQELEYAADVCLAQAAHMEWIAWRAEQGLIRWGGRLNRCGYQPETDDD